MQSFCRLGVVIGKSLSKKQAYNAVVILQQNIFKKNNIYRTLHCSSCLFNEESVAVPLRRRKRKSESLLSQCFVDIKQVRVRAGKGGDGQISFLSIWAKEFAGPDGGDGGNGGHVIFEVSSTVKDLSHLKSFIEAPPGEKGMSKDCFGRNADSNITKVPMGTIVRDLDGNILADLNEEGMMFLAARGGSGGHGNHYFMTDTNQAPQISEYGAEGEDRQYVLELSTMANIGLIGLPNAGKSTLLRAISRARPKVAAYPFTTLRPHIGMVLYDDYEQVAVADLPGLIEDSHKNRGLGIMFLKHAERCAALLFIIDLSVDEPWSQLDILRDEIEKFSPKLNQRPSLVIANKIDLPEAEENLKLFQQKINLPIIPISAKVGINVTTLLKRVRLLYDQELNKQKLEEKSDENSQ